MPWSLMIFQTLQMTMALYQIQSNVSVFPKWGCAKQGYLCSILNVMRVSAVQQDLERFPPNIMNTDYPVFHDDQLLSIEVELNPDITNDL